MEPLSKILIIDSQPTVRLALRRFLESEQHECVAAATLEEGLQLGESWDLAIIDESTLGPTPFETALLAAGRDRTLVTGPAPKAADFESSAGYLSKPLDYTQMGKKVREVLSLRAAAPGPEPGSREPVTLPLSSGSVPAGTMLSASAAMAETKRQIERLAPHEIPVLITGESGTGKELVAQALHEQSPRASQPFVAIHCGAIPPDLLESELFGHEKGSFTDAHRSKPGKFELAGKGTILLDEIGEMPLELQAKLLRVLQEREMERVGGVRSIPVHARVLAATNRDLREQVAQGRFREDLRHRIDVARVHLPPLRDREDDVELLAAALASRYAREYSRTIRGFSDHARRQLNAHAWPGNVRELENVLRRAIVLSDSDVLRELPIDTAVEPSSAVLEDHLDAFVAQAIGRGESAEMVRRNLLELLDGVLNRHPPD